MSNPFLEKMRSIGFVGTRLRADRETFQRDYDKQSDAELRDYAAERKAGALPDGTYRKQVDKSKRISDKLGTPYRGDNRTEMLQKAGLAGEVKPIRRADP